jgi:hypothetical protein
MIRNYKVFGLAIMATLAFGAFMAQTASANPLTCEGLASGSTCYGTGKQETTQVFASPGGTVSCVEAIFKNEGAVGASNAVSTVTSTPSYPTEKAGGGNNCTAFGFAGAHIKTNGCDFHFDTPTRISAGVVTWHPSQVHLLCPTGGKIEITPTFLGSSVCTQSVPAQTPTGGHITGINDAGSNPMAVTLEVTLKEIHYTGTGSSCGNAETHSDATLTGNVTITCYSDAEHKKTIGCTFS